jgi:predicted nucleic-acid-binding protein
VVWVLSSGYEYAKADIVNLLKQLILTAEVKLEAHDAVRVALKEFEKGKADLSDYLIGHLNKQRGCETTITFDKKAAKSASFSLI